MDRSAAPWRVLDDAIASSPEAGPGDPKERAAPPWLTARLVIGLAVAAFMSAIPAAGVLGGLASSQILQMHGLLGISGWKWLFIMVSLPCVLLGFVVLKMLADRPDEASWLNKEESGALKAMLAAETYHRPKTSVFGAIFDVRVIVLALVQFGFTLGSYGIGIWMPLILKEEGLGDGEIALLLFVPYAIAILGMLAWAWLADRTGNKIGNLTLACLLGAAGFGLYYFWTGSLLLGLTNLTLALVGPDVGGHGDQVDDALEGVL